jgi:hypothetical protein
MHAAGKNSPVPTSKGRKPIVELAIHFGLLDERERASRFGVKYTAAEISVAHDLINPLLYFDKAAKIMKQGFVRARSGRELTVDDAFALFENYLGIARRNEQIAMDVRSLNAGRAQRRSARRRQALEIVMRPTLKALAETQGSRVQDMKRSLAEDYGFDPIEIEKNSEAIERLALLLPLSDPDLQMMIRRHTQHRKTKPRVKRFMLDVIERHDNHAERVRALAAARKRRSRLKLKQSIKPGDDSVQVALT